jgi:hypothetical protein
MIFGSQAAQRSQSDQIIEVEPQALDSIINGVEIIEGNRRSPGPANYDTDHHNIDKPRSPAWRY